MADDHRPVHAETSEEEGITSPLDFFDPEIANTPLANATLGTLVTTLQAASISYSAPMPPASEFAAFDNALPGTALVIRTMAVDEQKHRHSLED